MLGGLENGIWGGILLFGGFLSVAMLLGDPFGYFGVVLIGGGVLGEWEDLRSKFGLVFPCLEAFFV